MKFAAVMVSGRIVGRRNRFVVEVEVGGCVVAAHMANSGRVVELMTPGAPALLRPCQNASKRLTAYDLVLVQVAGVWVSADARLPNALLREALAAQRIEALRDYPGIKAEARESGSRIDFLLTGPSGRCLVETKSVTLVQGGVAMFPDAPTRRGSRHLRTLIDARKAGDAAAVVFVVQREDASALRPCDEVDPVFGRTLREAKAAGVTLLAYRCRVAPCAIELADGIEVRLDA